MSKAGQDLVRQTFDRLVRLYDEEGLRAGTLMHVAIKPGWNVVLGTDGQCGMAMNFTGWEGSFGTPQLEIEQLQALVGRDLFAVADACLDDASWQMRSVGVASVSALSQPLLTREALQRRGYWVGDRERDLASLLRPDDICAVVGFGGGVQRLLGKCKELHVTDMRPRQAFQTLVIGENVYWSPTDVIVHTEPENEAVLSRASVVSITGSALVNGTFADLLSYARNARVVVAYGASAALLPDVLIESGVHMLHVYRVSDPAAFQEGAFNDMGMERVLQRTQESLAIGRADL